MLVALPADPTCSTAAEAVEDTPRWERTESDYHALGTSTPHGAVGEWRVIQHQRAPLGTEVAQPANG